jgi:RNA polymerase sigma factor (sigma-70 family)
MDMYPTGSDNDDLEEVIHAAIAGRPGAFDKLFLRFQAFVLYVLSSLRCGHAEDVASVVWQRVMEKIGTVENRGVGAFRAWLRQVARHLAADHAKACDAANLFQFLEEPASPISLAEQILLRDLLKKFSDRLSPVYRRVYEMRFVEDLSNPEIADRLGLDVKHVAVLVFRIRREFAVFFHGGQERGEGQ